MTSWTRELARPLPASAVIILALNDHVLKQAHVLPGWVTGKLSDVAGLFFFPILLFALARAVLGVPRSRVVRASLLAGVTVLMFAAIKVVPAFNAIANHVLGDVALDPTDLAACPLAIASVLYLRQPPSGGAIGGRLLGRVAVLLAAVASMATSAPRMARNYPGWEVRGAAHQRAACTEIAVEVVTSGKTGIGVLVTRAHEPSCEARVDAARLRITEKVWPALAVPAGWDDARSLYLGFAFDNEALWNAGVREAALELDLSSNGARTTLRFPLSHVWTGPHRMRDRSPRVAPSQTSMPMAVDPAPGGER